MRSRNGFSPVLDQSRLQCRTTAMSALQARGLRSRVWTIRTIAFSFLVMPSPVLAYIEGNEAELVRHGGVSNEVIHSLCNFCLCGDLRRQIGRASCREIG